MPESSSVPNPALADLAGLIGDWSMVLSNASFLPHPADRVSASATFVWIENGALLALYQGEELSGPPGARWIIGRDDSGDDYTVLYADARGVSRVYAMRFTEGKWTMWRETTDFSQRFTAMLSDDGNTISGRWEKRLGAGPWEHDFELTYQRST